MALAVARAMEAGATTLICASTGNTSASAAAYAARCGLRAVVVLPAGRVAAGKLVQALAHGARVIPISGNFDQALAIVRRLGERPGMAPVNSINPFRLEGQKTAAFEVVESLGRAPDRLFLPVGNAGNITAYWKGFCEWEAAAQTGLPRMHGAQAAGAAPIVRGKAVSNPRTIASAIRIGNPASWQSALQARDESRGSIESVTDAEILEAQGRLAREEGLLVEPASAAGLALLARMSSAGQIDTEETIVCVLTGQGLKDPQSFLRGVKRPVPVEASLEAVLAAIEQV
jgi:threonine synthase